MKKLLFTLIFPAFALAQSQDQNYIKTTTYKDENQTNKNVQVTYFDGLGRPIQRLDNAQSDTGKNIVTHIEYDNFGRQVKEYLPYKSDATSLDYNGNALAELTSYYGSPDFSVNKNPNAEAATNPYSEKLFESSPLDRVLKQAAPGDAWAMGSGHEIKFDYQTNEGSGANAVNLYTVTTTWNATKNLYETGIAKNGNYSVNTLYKTITKDENNNTSEEFKDKENRVVLKRTFNDGDAHNTYYVYDDYGNLTYVIPPLAEGAYDQVTLEGLCYQYQYDYRNRLAAKKLPGKQWEFIVYDKLDHPVATGPAKNPFGTNADGIVVTQYDVFGRVTQTGWKAITIDATQRGSLQASINSGSNPFVLDENDLLTKSYYDNYDFTEAPNSISSQVEGQDVATSLKGMATGSWVRILTNERFVGETTYTLYDIKYRPIRSYSKNYLGGYTQVDSKLDFVGKTLYTTTYHKRATNDLELVVRDDFTYSNQDRLLTHTQQLNGGDVQLIASNTYDELGQLISKNVGGSATSTTPLQKVDYNYNIRGWLKGINDINNLTKVGTTDPTDLFSFKISYENPTDTNKALFNGNISETYWRSLNDDLQRKYDYTYDHLNRLLEANFSKPQNTQFVDGFKEKLSYDKNGNILTLQRNGAYDDDFYEYEIDNLTYGYDTQNKNQLNKVTDASGWDYGFSETKDPDTDGISDGQDYYYDTNGNMTSDQNKGITDIIYNHLNLPTSIVFDGNLNTRIEYIYDATGKKVQKKVYYIKKVRVTCGGSSSKATGIVRPNPVCYNDVPTSEPTDYLLGGFQYKNNVLELLPHAEGYVKNNGGVYRYMYNYTDHLGNVRVTYGDLGDGTAGIEEESNYYPFGAKHQGYNEPSQYPNYWGNVTTSSSNLGYKYKYNGKEWQDELGLNVYDYGAMMYDPATGRRNNIDPLAELSRRWSTYSYAYNNPMRFTDPDGMLPVDNVDDKKEEEQVSEKQMEKEVEEMQKITDEINDSFKKYLESQKSESDDNSDSKDEDDQDGKKVTKQSAGIKKGDTAEAMIGKILKAMKNGDYIDGDDLSFLNSKIGYLIDEASMGSNGVLNIDRTMAGRIAGIGSDAKLTLKAGTLNGMTGYNFKITGVSASVSNNIYTSGFINDNKLYVNEKGKIYAVPIK